jgi:oligoendopeptidase F
MGRKKLMAKKEELPVWDLSALYKNVDDPKIKSDAKKNLAEAMQFAKKYRGLVAKLTPGQAIAAFKHLESILNTMYKLIVYAELVFSTDSQNPKNSVLVANMTDFAASVGRELVFFDLELMDATESKLKEFVASPVLLNYRHYLQNISKYRPHHLSEKEEQIFNDKSITSMGAFIKLFDQHFASRKFKFANTEKQYTETELLNMLTDPDREKRKKAGESLTRGFLEDSRMLTLIYNNMVKDKAIYDRWHKYKNPEDSRHLSNEIDQKTVDAMAETVQANYGIVEDFYNFKKQVMQLSKLMFYDRYAPISKSDKTYNFGEAKEMILKAFEKLSPEFQKAAKDFFDKKWIHAPVQVGKRGGAYCMYITPDTHPVVFVNYMGRARDIQTLAHELGHGINAYMMRKQTTINFDTPLILAETASVFGEMLVFDDLKEKISDPQEKFSLYIDKIQDTFATVFRQTSMYKFEQDFHKLQKQKGELTTEEINKIWIECQKGMFGNSVDNSGQEQWWSYIPHFLHAPFYVYAYSFGELLVLSLYAQYKKDPKSFVPKYLEMMRAGNSKTPQEILKPFGIDLSDRKFWQGGVNIIKDLVSEAKEIYKLAQNKQKGPKKA